MNKLDPNVDSDRDHRNDPTSTMGSSDSGYGAATTSTTHGSTNAGPHNSNLMNKLDPRVDSDVDHRSDPTSTVGSTGADYPSTATAGHGAGYGASSTGVGHGTTMGHTAAHTPGHTPGSSITPGSGSAPHTAGPYDSDLANKLDPR